MVIFLSLLEVGLRFAGHLHSLTRTDRTLLGPLSVIAEKEKGGELPLGEQDYVIMAVGDSYTYGGDDLTLSEIYPYILERKIEDNNFAKKYQVVNAGVCEYNSKQVLIRLPNWVEKYQPDMILLLVGATDRFNFAGYSFYEMGPKSFFRGLRIYKMARITLLNLEAMSLERKAQEAFASVRKVPSRDITGFPLESRTCNAAAYIRKMSEIIESSTEQTIVDRAWYYFNKGERKKAIKMLQKALNNDSFNVEILVNLALFYYSDYEGALSFYNMMRAEYYFERALEIDPESEFVLKHLVSFYLEAAEFFLLRRGMYDYAVHYVSRLIELNPHDIEFYYEILKSAYRFQGRYEANRLARLFQDIAKNNPHLRQDKLFLKHLKFFKNKDKVENTINRQMKKNLEEIVQLCEKYDIELVVQNYPYSHKAANKALKKIALENDLLFVDHNKVFNQILKEADPDEYLEGSELCTYKGFRIMAENIFDLLEKEGFLK